VPRWRFRLLRQNHVGCADKRSGCYVANSSIAASRLLILEHFQKVIKMFEENRRMPFLVLKIGGSVFSDKSRPNSLLSHVLDWYADLIASDYHALSGRLILLTGGGSFGHSAVRDAAAGPPEKLLGLTDAVFALKSHWTARLRERGVPVMPLQVSSFARFNTPDHLVLSWNPIREVLDQGILPVLSGDVVFKEADGFEILGSDRVPELCFELGCVPLRVVMLTNKPGIIMDGPLGKQVLPYIDPLDSHRALSLLWKEDPSDVTSGMRGKLESLIQLARRGAECIIAEGRPIEASFSGIAELGHAGSPNIPHTRIALTRLTT
jgi:isopentenyl phosphate kinase